MIRTIVAAALAATAIPAAAQTHVLETHAEAGAAAGRSPHKAYRQNVAETSCGKQMHSLPGGKLPHYGMRQNTACTTTLASADATPAQAAE